MSLDELKPGYFYSNGAFGKTWGVRQFSAITTCPDTGNTFYQFKGVAGVCRRKKGECTPEDFANWAKYEVALQETDWKRVGNFDPLAG